MVKLRAVPKEKEVETQKVFREGPSLGQRLKRKRLKHSHAVHPVGLKAIFQEKKVETRL